MAARLPARRVRPSRRWPAHRTPQRPPVTGGAFRRFDDSTAELKRIWTDSRHRRQGHARALLVELEAEIAARGYRSVYLTTGDRQPEAEALYLSTGTSGWPSRCPPRVRPIPSRFRRRCHDHQPFHISKAIATTEYTGHTLRDHLGL